MSWNFGGLVVKKKYAGAFEELFRHLGLGYVNSGNSFPVEIAFSQSNKGSAITDLNGTTLIINHLLPFDCSFMPGEFTKQDENFASYSNITPVLVFMLDGISGTYAFSYYADGKNKRRWAAISESEYCSEGELLEEEKSYIKQEYLIDKGFTDRESRVLKVMEGFMGISFETLISDHERMYHLYY